MRRFQPVCAAVALPLLLGACSGGSATSPAPLSPASAGLASPSPGSSGAAATLSVGTPTAAALDPRAELEGDQPAPAPSPTWDPVARASATEHAGATMAAFARPDLPEDQWWADLAPLLSLSAQEAYATVDPAEVPPRQVTGGPVLTDTSSAWLARVDVPTDVGTYALLLVREDGTSPWRTETITPPAELSEPAGR